MIDGAALRHYLQQKPGAVEEFPFGPDPLVLKVGGKMFALLSLTADPTTISLKCDPIHAEWLREQYPAITPGYHLDKRHWITATLDQSLAADLVRSLVDESYRLVVKGLSRSKRQELGL